MVILNVTKTVKMSWTQPGHLLCVCVCVTRQDLYGAEQPERYPRTTKEGPEGSQRTAAQDQGVDGDSTAACLKTRAAAISGAPRPPPTCETKMHVTGERTRQGCGVRDRRRHSDIEIETKKHSTAKQNVHWLSTFTRFPRLERRMLKNRSSTVGTIRHDEHTRYV